MPNDLILENSKAFHSIKINSSNIKMSSNLLVKPRLVLRNSYPKQLARIKRFRKRSLIRIVRKVKRISKFNIFKSKKLKFKSLNLSRKSKSKIKSKKPIKFKKRKFIRRYHKIKMFRRKKKRFSRLYKRRRFLKKVRNRRFKYNKKASRKKLIRRFSSKKLTKLLKKRILFYSSRKGINLANKSLLNKYLNELFFQRIRSKRRIKVSVRVILRKRLRRAKFLRTLFDSISFKLDNLVFKHYIIKSSVFLRMTEEEKLAYLDKLNITLAEKLKILNS